MISKCYRLLLFGLLLGAVSDLSHALDAEIIHRDNVGAVVIVEGERTLDGVHSQGSGCVVHVDGYIIVSAHQVTGITKLSGRFQDGTTVNLRPVEVDESREIALLKCDAPLQQAAKIGDATKLNNGSALMSIAAPINLEFSTVLGTVASTNRTFQGHPAIQANLTATQGSSGGPVFDASGALVGVITGELVKEDFTIVMPINNAYALMRRHGAMEDTGSTEGEMDYALIPDQDLEPNTKRAIDSYNRGVKADDWKTKLDAYNVAVKLAPDFFEAWYNLGVAANKMGDLEQATSAFEKAYRLKPKDTRVLRNLGRLLLLKKESTRAIALFEKAATLDTQNPRLLNELGEAYRQDKQFAKAVNALEKAISLNKNYALAHYNLGLVYMEQNQAEQAILYLERYLELSPGASDRNQVTQAIQALKAE